MIALDWAADFLDAIALRPRAWEGLRRNRRVGNFLAPLLILGDTEHHARHLGAIDERKLSTVIPDIIPACAVGIHDFWEKYVIVADLCLDAIESRDNNLCDPSKLTAKGAASVR